MARINREVLQDGFDTGTAPIRFYNPDLSIRNVNVYRGDILGPNEVPRVGPDTPVLGSYNNVPREISISGKPLQVVNPFVLRSFRMGWNKGLPDIAIPIEKYRNDANMYQPAALDREAKNTFSSPIDRNVNILPPETPSMILPAILPETSKRPIEQNPSNEKFDTKKICIPCLIGWAIIILLVGVFLKGK